MKDLEDAVGYVTTRGSAAFADTPAATADSPLVERLRAAGCVVVGKTNTPELGQKADTVNPLFGATRNPWALDRSPGGSSGGSAAAVAAGLVPLATGSDGGGSIRIPCAATGLTGLKPSLGRVPGGGSSPPDWPGLSTRGPMARTARDLALVLDVVVGPEATDLVSLPLPEASWSRSLVDLHPPRRVAWSPTLGYARADAEVLAVCEAAVGRLEAAGTEVVVVDDVFAADPVDEWLTLVGVYCLRVLEPFRDDPDVWGRVDPGLAAIVDYAAAGVTAAQFARALDACHALNVRLVELFHDAPLLLTPTVAGQLPRGRRARHDRRRARRELGAVHVPVQHDPLAGRHGVRGLHRRRACRSACRWSARSMRTSRSCGRWPCSRICSPSIRSLRSERREAAC